jgi:hypothetical protein
MGSRVLGAVVAVALVAAGFAVRSATADDDDAARVVWCDPELLMDCGDLGSDARRISSASAYAELVAISEADAPDAWLTVAPWPAMVDDTRQRAGRTPLFAAATSAVAITDLTWLAWNDRADVLEDACGTVTWTCLVDSDGTWGDLGGADSWGTIAIGVRDPSTTATGVLTVHAALGDRLGTPFPANEVNTLETVRWLRDVAELLPDLNPAQGSALAAMLAVGPAAFGGVIDTSAAVAEAEVTATARQGQLRRLPVSSAPPVVAVVAGDGAGDVAGAAGSRLRDAGWSPAGAAALDGVPDAGVMVTVWTTWDEQR